MQANIGHASYLDEYDFTFPKRIPEPTGLRFFDCDFVVCHGCAVFIGPSGCLQRQGWPTPTISAITRPLRVTTDRAEPGDSLRTCDGRLGSWPKWRPPTTGKWVWT